jgi:hypothetical protein
MIKIDRTSAPPASLASERLKTNGTYNKPDVIKQLCEDFHDSLK